MTVDVKSEVKMAKHLGNKIFTDNPLAHSIKIQLKMTFLEYTRCLV